MISYIDTYKDQFGVEAICRVLKQADRGFITSRGYRKASTRTPSARVRLPSFSGHPISADLVSVGEDVHCESTAQEVHAGVSA